MAGLVPAIHVFAAPQKVRRGCPDQVRASSPGIKSGHDERVSRGELRERFAHTNFNFKQPHCFSTQLRNPAAQCARAVHQPFASKCEGVGNAGRPLHPQPRAQSVVKHTSVVTTSPPDSPGIPAHNGFNGFLRALVSAKSGRMCERAALTGRPSLDLSPWCSKAARA